MTITLGWWLIPLLVTVVTIGWWVKWDSGQPPAGDYGAIGQGLGSSLMLLAAVVVSLLSWIAYLAIALFLK